eukprot:6485731-Amphidinium_carterae.1
MSTSNPELPAMAENDKYGMDGKHDENCEEDNEDFHAESFHRSLHTVNLCPTHLCRTTVNVTSTILLLEQGGYLC